ncbi:MAG TPA: hypothetical protein PK323_13240 [Bacteroidia bacterium]|nr:hypothetical protein [Bacteroidia bacterium]
MNTKTLILIAVATFAFIGTSCHKCVECIEYNSQGGKDIEYPEICGKKAEIDDYRKYQEGNVNPGNKVKCEERKTTLF